MQKESKILEGHMLKDHIHMLISIPPKYAVSQVVGYVKGNSAIHIARNYGGRGRNFTLMELDLWEMALELEEGLVTVIQTI